jgi:[ribosomal protein S5]-alanine N-acetyltransferase
LVRIPYDRAMSSSRWRFSLSEKLLAGALGPELRTQRLLLRPLRPVDVFAWQEVRNRCAPWLLPWEPLRPSGGIDPAQSRAAFEARCEQRDRERSFGTSYGFGIFENNRFIGECNINNVQRGAMQGGYVGYWIDESRAGFGLMPESVAAVLRFGFEDIGLHRLQISIIPRNTASHRVVEKLNLRSEGIALRYIEINGVWEDHVRYAMTSEEWSERRSEFAPYFLPEI